MVLPEHLNCAGPSRSQRDASPCFYRTFRGLYRLQRFSNTQTAGCASTSCRPTVHSCFTYRLPPAHAAFRESAQLQSVSHVTRARWLSLLSSSRVLVSSLRVRDHRHSARKQAFPRQRSRLRVRAGPAPGASGHTAPRSKQRGGLPFKPAPSQPQSGVQSNPQLDLTQQQAAAKNSVARQQNSASKQPAILRKTARSRRISSDTCRVCAGRGFQIIEEELLPCSACNGTNWAQPSSSSQAVQAGSVTANLPKALPASSGADDSPVTPDAVTSDPSPGRGRTKRGGRSLTEADKAKIGAAMKGRRWTDEHRKNISESMKGLWKSNATRRSQVSASMKNKPKVCSYCGTGGHNRLGCPKLHPEKQHTEKEKAATTGTRGRRKKTGNTDSDIETQQKGQTAKEAEALTKRVTSCSYCGEPGHNRRGCPQLAKEQQEEEKKRLREQHGPLWGLAGVEEQRMLGERQRVLVFPVPARIEDTVNQAAAAVVRAHAAGIRRQKLELLLPQAGATSVQGSWPGGIRQQAQVAIPSLIEPLLRQLKQEDAFQGRMGAEWMDETDCVGSWQNERLAAVMFPTADTLTQVRQLARVKGPHRLMLLINPQWQTGGQIVSDFGFGRARSDADKFLAAVQDVYCLERVRVLGDDIRLLKCYPGDWQVHYTWPNGRGSLLMGVEPTRPTYARLVEMLKSVPNTRASRSWVDRVLDINNLKGVSGDSHSSLTRGSYSEDLPCDEPQSRVAAPPSSVLATRAAPAVTPPAATADVSETAPAPSPSLRQRLQDALAEQQEAAKPSIAAREALQPGEQATQSPGVSAEAAVGDRNTSAFSSSTNSDSSSRSEDRGSGSTSADAGKAARSARTAAELEFQRSKAAGVVKGDVTDGVAASDQHHPREDVAVDRPHKDQTAGRVAGRKLDGDDVNVSAMSSRSIDGDDDGMRDRFGSVDIITGKPVRDLKLEPVLQLVKWRESLFGSRDSVSESLDREDTTD